MATPISTSPSPLPKATPGLAMAVAPAVSSTHLAAGERAMLLGGAGSRAVRRRRCPTLRARTLQQLQKRLRLAREQLDHGKAPMNAVALHWGSGEIVGRLSRWPGVSAG